MSSIGPLLGAATRRSAGGGGGTPIIESLTLASLRNNYGGWVGCKFTVGGASLTISKLGRWIVSGNSQSHQVNLRDSSGAELAIVTIATSGATAGEFKYESITPVSLSAGGVYYLTSQETSGGDQWYDESLVTSESGIAVNNSAYTSMQTGVPQINATQRCYAPVNALST